VTVIPGLVIDRANLPRTEYRGLGVENIRKPLLSKIAFA